MIQGIEEINLPPYATLRTATVTMQNMGDQTIEATLSIDRDITPDFSTDWVIKFRGVEFIHPLRAPQASKSSSKFNPEYPLTFYHKGIYDLKRKFFFSLPAVESSTAVPDKYEASLSLNVRDFADAYAKVLEYYYGDYITIDFNTNPSVWFSDTEPYDTEKTAISISYTKMWDLLSAFYNNYNVSWWIDPVQDGGETKYVIKIGYDRSIVTADGETPHPFAYGFKGGLLKMERQIQSSDIINIMLGRGGEKNLPYRYFHKKAEDSDGGGDEATFRSDPDWIPELENIYFDGLRDINFRYWIQGWKDAHYRYDTATGDISDNGDHLTGTRRYAVDEHWAYDMGFTADRFDPVEYVKDNASIAKYGELWGGLQAVEEIYPSIQGVYRPNLGRVDQLVDVQQIDADFENSQAALPEVIEETIPGFKLSLAAFRPGADTIFYTSKFDRSITVKEGYKANLYPPSCQFLNEVLKIDGNNSVSGDGLVVLTDPTINLTVMDTTTGEELSPVDIPSGTYYFIIRLEVEYNFSKDPATTKLYFDCVYSELKFTQTILPDTKADKNSFSIWIKNVWETEKLGTETDAQYAERVWRPILGNHLGDDAAVVFSTGLLSISEDYEFTLINRMPEYDTSKTLTCVDEDGNTINVPSHWKLTLRRSDAEYDATGKYLPNELINAVAGEDYFFFIGVDLPHQYVLYAEQRLNAYKRQQLDDVSEINPTWAVELSKIRINHPQAGETVSLISQLATGVDVELYSKWFVSNPNLIGSEDEDAVRDNGTYRTTIQTLTFKYDAPKKDSPGFLPSVTVTLADKPNTTASSVSLLQGSVDALTSRINSMSAPYVIDVIKSTDDVTAPTDYNVLSAKKSKRVLLSSEEPDYADGHITFNQGLTSQKKAFMRSDVQFGDAFVSGSTGMGGYVDSAANAELESLFLRSWLEVPEIRFNRASVLLGDQWNAPGGGIVESVEVDFVDMVPQRTGTITLKLEQGEIGAIAVDDICKGYFHDFHNTDSNSTADTDDGKGNTEFSGFCTVYFRVTEILESDGVNKRFRYMLRNTDGTNGDWHSSFHPYEQMHFVAYGNFNDTSRQKSAYQTRSYTRYLKGVDDWEFTKYNVAMQFGDLSNLQIFGLNMTGYSAYLQNIYMSGTLEKVTIEAEVELSVESNTGDFFIADGETLMLTCAVRKAWQNLTDDVVGWTITRDSADSAADSAWNAAHPMYSPMFALTQSDIGATTLNANALFTITATGDGWTASKTVAVRTLRIPTTLTMRFVSEYGEYDTFVGYGDTVRFRAIVEDGLRNDYTAEYDQWTIERHNGDSADDVASDGVWNVTRAAISAAGEFSIEWSLEHDDLQAERATFIITAQKGSAMSTKVSGTLSI